MSSNQLDFANFFSTTLAQTITASDTVIYLNSLPTPSEGYLVIEPDSTTGREIIYYTSKGVNYVTCPSVADGRGVGGTTAASHSNGATVQMNVTAEDLRAIQDGSSNTGMHQYFDESFSNYILSGGSVTQATGLIASISSGVAYINGRRLPFNAMSRTLTASKDTYIDLLETDGSNIATVSYTELASGATGSTPVSNGLHIAKVNTTASAIATSVQAFTDTLGNPIKQTSPTSMVGVYNPYKFRVYRTAAYSTAAASQTTYPFDTKSFDTNGNVDVVTNKGRYSVPVAGIYQFSGAVTVNATAGFFLVSITVNGAAGAVGGRSFGTVAQTQVQTVSATLQLNAGDYVELQYYTDGSQVSAVGTASCHFSGFLVSQS